MPNTCRKERQGDCPLPVSLQLSCLAAPWRAPYAEASADVNERRGDRVHKLGSSRPKAGPLNVLDSDDCPSPTDGRRPNSTQRAVRLWLPQVLPQDLDRSTTLNRRLTEVEVTGVITIRTEPMNGHAATGPGALGAPRRTLPTSAMTCKDFQPGSSLPSPGG
jgi:hypothetical protein